MGWFKKYIGNSVKKWKSILHQVAVQLSIRFISNERLRKKIIVYIYNISIFFTNHNCGKKKSLFNPEILVKDKRFFCNELYKGNFYYGISNMLKSYAGYAAKIGACIEHGVYFGALTNDRESIHSGYPAVITFSDRRQNYIRKTSDKLIFPIGPYIYYAKGVLGEPELKEIKNAIGKSLLVFPKHSIDRIESDFDYDGLIKCVEEIKIKNNYQTVHVCLYYRDIELGRSKIYQDAGFTVVCAGRREDPDFLNRLKTFILLSDATMSNSVGTHVGYCIALDKPHYIINQNISYIMNDDSERRQIKTTYLDSSLREKKEVLDAFDHYSETITEYQKYICNKYWGLDCIRTASELKAIFNICDAVLLRANKKERYYKAVMEELLVTEEIDMFTKKILHNAMK